MRLAIDTETTGFNSFKGDYPFAITTSTEDYKTEYIEASGDTEHVARYLKDQGSEAIFHNAKFDLLMLETLGIAEDCVLHDTMIMAHVYNPDEPYKSLKKLAEKYLGIEPTEEAELKAYMREHKLTSYADVPRAIMEPYAVKDAVITMKMFQFYEAEGVLDDPVYKMEMDLLRCLVSMQRRGVKIDSALCYTRSGQCEDRIDVIHSAIISEYGDWNYNSTKQLAEFLFETEGLTCSHYTPKGNPSLDAYSLSQYDHPIIPKIMEIKELAKLKTTYFDGLLEHADDEDVVHCDLFQVGAKTGRFSCKSPNLQNIPRGGAFNVREAFVCRDGYMNFFADYSQIELRIFAHYSKEQHMISELLREGGDLHVMTAQKLFDKQEISKVERNVAKTLNFGIIYGIGANTFAMNVNKEYPEMDMNYLKAKTFIGRFYRAFKEISFFTGRVKRKILTQGYITDIFGRRYPCPKDQAYKAVNYLIQGCGASYLKDRMVKVYAYLESLGDIANLLLCIHDELIIEVKYGHEQEVMSKVKEIMEDHETFRVPITVNVESTATNWLEKLPYDSLL